MLVKTLAQDLLKKNAIVYVEMLYNNTLLQSEAKIFYQSERYVPYRTLIVNLSQGISLAKSCVYAILFALPPFLLSYSLYTGVLKSITWETTRCMFNCDCVDNMCARSENNCGINNYLDQSGPCDIRVKLLAQICPFITYLTYITKGVSGVARNGQKWQKFD
jgi:hypothetical protein